MDPNTATDGIEVVEAGQVIIRPGRGGKRIFSPSLRSRPERFIPSGRREDVKQVFVVDEPADI